MNGANNFLNTDSRRIPVMAPLRQVSTFDLLRHVYIKDATLGKVLGLWPSLGCLYFFFFSSYLITSMHATVACASATLSLFLARLSVLVEFAIQTIMMPCFQVLLGEENHREKENKARSRQKKRNERNMDRAPVRLTVVVDTACGFFFSPLSPSVLSF